MDAIALRVVISLTDSGRLNATIPSRRAKSRIGRCRDSGQSYEKREGAIMNFERHACALTVAIYLGRPGGKKERGERKVSFVVGRTAENEKVIYGTAHHERAKEQRKKEAKEDSKGRYLNDVRTGRMGGGSPKVDESTVKLCVCDNDKGEGPPKVRKFGGLHLSMARQRQSV